MQSWLTVAFGAFCVVLGVVWAIKPVTMGKLQQQYLYLGAGGDEVQINETLGRVAGLVLAAAGVYLVVT